MEKEIKIKLKRNSGPFFLRRSKALAVLHWVDFTRLVFQVLEFSLLSKFKVRFDVP